MKTFEAVARACAAEGVTTVFGVLGDANLGWWAALADLGVTVVPARQEWCALAMAEGFSQAAQLPGGADAVGVATVTSGPGLVQAGLALADAARSGAATVLFAGDLAATATGNPAEIDQRRFVEACGARFVPLRSPATAADDLAHAFALARAERTAVVFNAPMDLQAAPYPGAWPGGPRPPRSAAAPPAPAPAPAACRRVADLIAASSRPVVLAGRGAMRSGAAGPLLRLAETIGALTATTLPAKGYLDDDPFAVGLVGPLSSAVADELFATADLVLAFGAQLDRFTLDGRGPVFPEATVVSVNTEAAARGRNRPADEYIAGDAALAAEALLSEAQHRGLTNAGFRTDDVRKRLAAAAPVPCHSGPDRFNPREAMQVLERHLSADRHTVVVGSGHFFSWPNMHLRRPSGGNFLFGHWFGSIGLALPLGIGAALARPDRTVVVVEGDGSIMECIAEIETAARCGLRLLVVVVNDEGLGAERYKARLMGLDPGIAALPTPSLADVARALGAEGDRADDGESLERALAAFDVGLGIRLVDVRVDGDIPCDMYRKLHLGLPNEAPHQVAGPATPWRINDSSGRG